MHAIDLNADVTLDRSSARTERNASRSMSGVRGESLAMARQNRIAGWGLGFVLLLFGYEWLLSGLDKLFNRSFRSGLADEMRDSVANNPDHWYARFLADTVIPNASLVAGLVEWGEILVALGLFLGAAVWIVGDRLSEVWAQRIHLVTIGALLGSALMTTNYYFMDGNTLPWLKTSEPFDEGLGIDGFLTLAAIGLVVIHALAMRSRAAVAEASRDALPGAVRSRSTRPFSPYHGRRAASLG